jgi:peptide/nickel transport system substrate-binding protein
VPDQAAALIKAAGLVLTGEPGYPYYHYAFGIPFNLTMVYDSSDPWATSTAPVIRAELMAAGFDVTLIPAPNAQAAGEALVAGTAQLSVVPVTFSPYLSQTLAWYTMLLGPPGKNGSQDWTGFSDPAFDQLVETAGQQLNPDTAATYYARADTQLWDNMVSLPLFAEPAALAWSRTIGGVSPAPQSNSILWFAQLWAVRVPQSTNNTTPSLPGQ